MGILIAILVVSYSFYFTLVIKPQGEMVQKEADKQAALIKEATEKEEKKKARQENKTNFDNCIAYTETSYSTSWFRECKARDLLSNLCIDINTLSYDEYLKKYNLSEEEYKNIRGIKNDNFFAGLVDYSKRKDDCSCMLPLVIADRLNSDLKDSKDRCYSLYPQN